MATGDDEIDLSSMNLDAKRYDLLEKVLTKMNDQKLDYEMCKITNFRDEIWRSVKLDWKTDSNERFFFPSIYLGIMGHQNKFAVAFQEQ